MIDINSEIRKIVEFYNSKLLRSIQKDHFEIAGIIDQVISDYNSRNFNFSNYKSIIIKQFGKKRKVKQYFAWSTELFLSIYLKRCLDREFKIKYPNRNNHMHILFGTISSLRDMKDYAIVRFDFEDFFNSISSKYIYEKYIVSSHLERYQKDLFFDFISKCPYCYAGINTSNVMAEIICRQFDKLISNSFYKNGLIFYKRYVDDGILIFNRYIEREECISIIEKSLKYSFHTSLNYDCKTKLNKDEDKLIYISKRMLDKNSDKIHRFHYLGYQFGLNVNQKNKSITRIEYGITDVKIEKYTRRIENIIDDFLKNKNMELLRHRIRAFSCRTVYRRKKYSSMIWKVKGFTSNYNELRNHLLHLDSNSEHFLKNAIKDAFDRKKVKCPYFLLDISHKNPYCLYNNLCSNRALLFEENRRIGINIETLEKMCHQINIAKSNKSTYNSLLREYLIKMRVGH
ncbi:hypothetical protein NKE62_05290 [Akkermansia sp. Marseille-P9185]|uniref:hypothetical protein n=1 Tax=Akkermansia massiliensis TaxID=2927224 RepID=UPI00209C3760|nr:hypothetical protein [Akkermansia massiliensis]MCO8186327.1 hypothetical protein [Akkermansia massiliensis]